MSVSSKRGEPDAGKTKYQIWKTVLNVFLPVGFLSADSGTHPEGYRIGKGPSTSIRMGLLHMIPNSLINLCSFIIITSKYNRYFVF